MLRNHRGRFLTLRCGRKPSPKFAPRLFASVHVPQVANDGETLLHPFSSLPNDQVLPRRINHFFGHGLKLVDLQDALDLQKPLEDQTKIPSDNANTRCYEEYMPSDIVLPPLYLFKKAQRLSSDRKTPQLAWSWSHKSSDVSS